MRNDGRGTRFVDIIIEDEPYFCQLGGSVL